MRDGDAQLGRPFVQYADTKSNIEGLSGVPEGATAYATDTDEFGSYDGTTWTWGQGGSGTDSDAIHDNVAGEINAITEKASPIGADILLLEDSAASYAKKKVQITNLPGGADADAIHDNVSGEIAAVTEKATPVSADLLLIEDSESSNAKKRLQIGNLPSGGTDPNHAYYTKLAAFLEPDAIEPLQIGTFSYAVGSSETKFLLLAWWTRIGSAGKLFIRDPRGPLPLRNVTLTGLVNTPSARSAAVIIDHTLPSYANARTTYFDRLNNITTYDTKYLGLDTGGEVKPLLPGAYGAIVTHVTSNDFAWVALFGQGTGYPIDYELGDTTSDYMRFAHQMFLPINKAFVSTVKCSTGVTAPGQTGGAITYVLLPSTWSAISDPLAPYDFEDDFMGASLDTVTEWTRAQSTAGNVEIDTQYQWLKLIGSGTWGQNGLYSQSSIARATGKIYLVDIYIPAGITNFNNVNTFVGFSDGAGQSYTNFAHGVYFSADGSNNAEIYVFENGTSRGVVGSDYSSGNTYRIRITLNISGAATYEIQGGPEYQTIGGATWTDITPGTTSSATNTLHAGATRLPASTAAYLSHMRLY